MRRTLPSLVLLAAALMLFAPVAADDEIPTDPADRVDLCIITYTPAADFRSVQVAADLELSDEEMAQLLAEIDADGDGTITAAEVEAYEHASEHVVFDFESLGKLKLVVDEQAAHQVEFRTELWNFEGPIDAETSRLVTEHRTYHYWTQQDTSHWLEGGLYAEGEIRGPVVEEFVILDAPQGWVVALVNGEPYGTRQVSLESFGTTEYFSILFSEADAPSGGPQFLAAPGLLGALLALAAGAALVGAGRAGRK